MFHVLLARLSRALSKQLLWSRIRTAGFSTSRAPLASLEMTIFESRSQESARRLPELIGLCKSIAPRRDYSLLLRLIGALVIFQAFSVRLKLRPVKAVPLVKRQKKAGFSTAQDRPGRAILFRSK